MLVGIIATSGWNAPPPPTDASGEQQWENKAYCFPCYVMGVKSTFGNSGPDSGLEYRFVTVVCGRGYICEVGRGYICDCGRGYISYM